MSIEQSLSLLALMATQDPAHIFPVHRTYHSNSTLGQAVLGFAVPSFIFEISVFFSGNRSVQLWSTDIKQETKQSALHCKWGRNRKAQRKILLRRDTGRRYVAESDPVDAALLLGRHHWAFLTQKWKTVFCWARFFLWRGTPLITVPHGSWVPYSKIALLHYTSCSHQQQTFGDGLSLAMCTTLSSLSSQELY